MAKKAMDEFFLTDLDIPKLRKHITDLEWAGWKMFGLEISNEISIVFDHPDGRRCYTPQSSFPEWSAKIEELVSTGWGGGSIEVGNADKDFRFKIRWERPQRAA